MALPNETWLHGSPAFGLVALAPLCAAQLIRVRTGIRFAGGAVFGMLAHGLSSFWLYNFKAFAIFTLGLSTIAYGLLYGLAFVALSKLLVRWERHLPAVFALAWVFFEYFKSTGFLGYPWGLIAFSWSDVLPFIQIADSTSVYGPSFLLALANGVVAMASSPLLPGQGRRFSWNQGVATRRYAAFAVASFSIAIGYGAIRMSIPVPRSGSVDMLLCQQNTDSWARDAYAGVLANIRLADEAIARDGDAPDLICFSETSLRLPYGGAGTTYPGMENIYEIRPAERPLSAFIRDHGTWLFTGAPYFIDIETMQLSNSVLLIAPDGTVAGDYAKTHPVPFAEAIPFWDHGWFRSFMKDVVGLDSSWVMGTRLTLFELPASGRTYRFAAPICFEDAFAPLCREFALAGAEFWINLTNDSWSKTVSSETQHFVASRFRTIEHRRTLVRSTNAGITAVVGAFGETIASLPPFERASLRLEVPVFAPPGPTPYALFGDWFAALACFAVALLSFAIRFDTRKGRRKSS